MCETNDAHSGLRFGIFFLRMKIFSQTAAVPVAAVRNVEWNAHIYNQQSFIV